MAGHWARCTSHLDQGPIGSCLLVPGAPQSSYCPPHPRVLDAWAVVAYTAQESSLHPGEDGRLLRPLPFGSLVWKLASPCFIQESELWLYMWMLGFEKFTVQAVLPGKLQACIWCVLQGSIDLRCLQPGCKLAEYPILLYTSGESNLGEVLALESLCCSRWSPVLAALLVWSQPWQWHLLSEWPGAPVWTLSLGGSSTHSWALWPLGVSSSSPASTLSPSQRRTGWERGSCGGPCLFLRSSMGSS